MDEKKCTAIRDKVNQKWRKLTSSWAWDREDLSQLRLSGKSRRVLSKA